jgi:hypothetical protein
LAVAVASDLGDRASAEWWADVARSGPVVDGVAPPGAVPLDAVPDASPDERRERFQELIRRADLG